MNWSHSSLLLLFLLLLWGFPGGHTVVPPPLGPTDSTWELTLDEDFLGTSLNRSLWVPQQTATSGFTSGTANFTACYVDTPQNIAIGNGFLNLTLRKESANISCGNTNSNFSTPFTSASISTYYKWSQTYGFFEVRALLPNVTVYGVQETFWLWPVDSVKFGPWPYSGEIDFAEFYSRYSDLVVPYLHYVPASIDLSVTAYNCTLNLTDFNVYGVDWSNESITIYLNGKVCLKVRPQFSPFQYSRPPSLDFTPFPENFPLPPPCLEPSLYLHTLRTCGIQLLLLYSLSPSINLSSPPSPKQSGRQVMNISPVSLPFLPRLWSTTFELGNEPLLPLLLNRLLLRLLHCLRAARARVLLHYRHPLLLPLLPPRLLLRLLMCLLKAGLSHTLSSSRSLSSFYSPLVTISCNEFKGMLSKGNCIWVSPKR